MRKQPPFRIQLFWFALVWIVLWSSPAAAGSYRLVTLDYPPYEYSEQGTTKGIAVDIVRETFKLMGHDVSIEVLPWSRSIAMLKHGESDGIFTFFRNPEREQFAIFSSEPLLTQKISLWARRDAKITFNGNLSALRNYRIGVVRKTSYGEKFDTAVKNGTIRTVEAYTIEDCLNLLANGRIDLWVSNDRGAMFALKKSGREKEIKKLLPSIQDIPAYIGFSRKRHHDRLRAEFDKAFAVLKKSGRYDAILHGQYD